MVQVYSHTGNYLQPVVAIAAGIQKCFFFLEFREIKIRARLPNISLTFVFLPDQISSCHWSLFANSVSLTEPLMIHTNLNLKRSQFDPRETFDVQKTGEVLGKTNRLDTCHTSRLSRVVATVFHCQTPCQWPDFV